MSVNLHMTYRRKQFGKRNALVRLNQVNVAILMLKLTVAILMSVWHWHALWIDGGRANDYKRRP